MLYVLHVHYVLYMMMVLMMMRMMMMRMMTMRWSVAIWAQAILAQAMSAKAENMIGHRPARWQERDAKHPACHALV